MSFSKSMIHKSPWQRNTLICKPEQSGKTFVMLEKIMERLKEPDDGRDTVNFILCDNNLLLTEQTSFRVDQDLSQNFGEQKNFVEFSCHRRTYYHSLGDILDAITDEGVRNIISCTNRQRINDVDGIIRVLNSMKKYREKLFFRIWIDEADKFIKGIDDTFGPLLFKYDNLEMFCITATPSRLFEAYGYMNTLPIEDPVSDIYHGWLDNKIHIHEPSQTFIDDILSGPASSKLLPGTKWFIPGMVEKKTHHLVKHICVSYGMAVAVVNGDGISLKIPNFRNETPLDDSEEVMDVDFILEKDDVFNTKIKEIYETYGLNKYPFAITGYYCIQRGITISSHDFLLDYSIISGFTDESSASQISGRLKGNQCSWDTYKPCEVYTTQQFNDIVDKYEKKSRSLGSYVFHKEQIGNGTIIFEKEWDVCYTKKKMKPYNEKSLKFYEWKIKKIDSFLRSIMCQ